MARHGRPRSVQPEAHPTLSQTAHGPQRHPHGSADVSALLSRRAVPNAAASTAAAQAQAVRSCYTPSTVPGPHRLHEPAAAAARHLPESAAREAPGTSRTASKGPHTGWRPPCAAAPELPGGALKAARPVAAAAAPEGHRQPARGTRGPAPAPSTRSRAGAGATTPCGRRFRVEGGLLASVEGGLLALCLLLQVDRNVALRWPGAASVLSGRGAKFFRWLGIQTRASRRHHAFFYRSCQGHHELDGQSSLCLLGRLDLHAKSTAFARRCQPLSPLPSTGRGASQLEAQPHDGKHLLPTSSVGVMGQGKGGACACACVWVWVCTVRALA